MTGLVGYEETISSSASLTLAAARIVGACAWTAKARIAKRRNATDLRGIPAPPFAERTKGAAKARRLIPGCRLATGIPDYPAAITAITPSARAR